MLKIEDVEAFHKAFGHPIGDPKGFVELISNYGARKSAGNELIRLRMRLIYEEADELGAGFSKNDPQEVADALFDLLYVVYGAIIALGVPREIGDIVHKSNMSKGITCEPCYGTGMSKLDSEDCPKCHGTGIVPILREDGKVLKGPDWIDDKPLIAAEIERVCRDFDKDVDNANS